MEFTINLGELGVKILNKNISISSSNKFFKKSKSGYWDRGWHKGACSIGNVFFGGLLKRWHLIWNLHHKKKTDELVE